jgi:hypothetical protein
MVVSITKGDDSSNAQQETSGIANKLKMFNIQPKKQSIVVGSNNQKNIHCSNINSSHIYKNQLITSDLSGFVKVWKI